MKSFTVYLVEEGRREKTITTYVNEVKKFEKWYVDTFGEFTQENVSVLDVRDYIQYLKNTAKNKKGGKLSPVTISKKIESLRTYFRFLKEKGIINENPVEKIKLPKIQKRTEEPRWLTRNEKNKLVRFLNDGTSNIHIRNKAICYMMMHVGFRISEVVTLEISDIDFQKQIVGIEGKGGKYRRVEMNKDSINAIKDWLKVRPQRESERMFISQKGDLTTDGIQHIFRSLRKQTGLEELTPHVLRHTFGHDLAEKGYTIQLIADLMGHSDINTTRIYVRPGSQERRSAVDSISSEVDE